MVSCIFTSTNDLDAEFPAVAARNLGLDTVPLLCAREIAVPGAMERVIRTMLHYYAPADHSPVPRLPRRRRRAPRRPLVGSVGTEAG